MAQENDTALTVLKVLAYLSGIAGGGAAVLGLLLQILELFRPSL